MTNMNRKDLAGQTIGNWRLLHLLGEGAFGAVYEAEHHAIAGRRAAVKVLDQQSALQPDRKRRFVNEASAASRIAHENIVQVFDGGVTDEGACYVVMELLTGQSLSQIIAQRRWNVGRTVNLGVQAASALQAAHNIGIVHRDLKPDNLYIVPRDHNPEFLKVLDFGIAKLRDAEGETKAGIWLGTPGYMSPEQWQTIPDIDGRADIYALGVILYECMTGQLPYSGNTPYDWLNAHLTHPVPDPSVLAPMPPLLTQLIQRMLAKRREERPQSMGEVLSELQRCAVLRSNPWVRMMSEEPSDGRRRSGPLTLPLGSPVDVVPQISTMRQGIGELRAGSPPPERRKPLPYLPIAVAGATLCAAGLGAAHHMGWLAHALGGTDTETQVAPAAIALPASTQPVTAQRTRPPAIEEAAPVAEVDPALLRASTRPSNPKILPEELVMLGPGRFKMGSGRKHIPDGPAHTVEVKRFALGKYEVSVGEYLAFSVAAKLSAPTLWEGVARDPEQRSLPITLLTRDQAANYCRWRYGLWDGRLPTEIEWEFAARNGRSDRHYPWPGKHFEPDKVNAGKPTLQLVPVQSLPEGTTDLGILHMLGNAAEWTGSDGKRYPGSTAIVPVWAVVRGGAADTPVKGLSATARQFLPAEGRYPSVGFRCAARVPY